MNMDMAKLNYDDFYKFVMSAGILLFILSVSMSFYLLIKNPLEFSTLPNPWAIWIMLITILIGSGSFILWSGRRWNKNQKIIDEKLETDLKINKQKLIESVQMKAYEIQKVKSSKRNAALVEYKVASVLPGTVFYDLIDSGKVWFWIVNNEDKKYKAYVDTEFISDSYTKKIEGDYYGGGKEWHLNAFSGIRAPGMPIPQEIINSAKEGKRVEIKINCTIKDENNKLVEKKLPVSYVYDRKNKSWYFEP